MESRYKRIFIVGHSGAGKGVLAKALAEKLSWKHLDADFALGPSIGWPMNEVLGDEGELSFYKCLGEVLTHQKNQDNIIVTTDDSIVCSQKNREMLLPEFVVYLKVSVPVQLERITYNRPLLSSDGYDLFLDKLHIERDMHFEEVAKLTCNSDENDLDGHVKAVMKALQR
jgi:shikimate kinase